MSNPTLVVLDEGSLQVKVSWIDQKSNKIQNHVILSMISLSATTDGAGNYLDSNYTIGEEELAVDPKSTDAISTKHKNYQTSIHNRAVLHEALRQSGFGGKDVQAIVTLPINQFFSGNTKNAEGIAAKKANAMGDISNMNNCPLARIVSCQVAPESIPAWYNILIDESGEVNQDYYDADFVMVVDTGGTTTDITLIDGTGKPQRKTSLKVGVLDVIERLKSILAEEKVAQSVPQAHMNELLRTGTYRNTDISKLILKASRPVQSQILNKMFEFMDDPDALDHVVYAGGGAGLFGKELSKSYGNSCPSHISKTPDMDVANGLLKAELMKEAATA